jgi:hypothetical protein
VRSGRRNPRDGRRARARPAGNGESERRSNGLDYNAQPAIDAAIDWLARRPDVGTPRSWRLHPHEYERRTVGFLDRALTS